MTYKTILVYLNDARRVQRLMDVALPLARKMDAHIIALNVMPPIVVLPGGEFGAGSVTVDAHRDAYKADIAKIKTLFEEATRLHQAKSEWREADANMASATGMVIEHGRVCDLIIASQKDPSWSLSELLEQPDRLATESGRPVLLIPNQGKTVMPPKRATIAWNARPEAIRAVFDAMPLLQGTEEVNVLWVHPERDQPLAGDLPGADISATLARHGIKCLASQSVASDAGVASELLREAHAFGSDLLVMGVYGHSRLREFVLGGASRDMLNLMDRPVLMSH